MYMSITKTKTSEVRINLLISKELRKEYKLHCLNNNTDMSERIRTLIIKDLKGEIK